MYNKADYLAHREERIKKQRAYNERNKEEANARRRVAYIARREEENAKRREYRTANREKVREQEKAHYGDNREKTLKKNKAWRSANPHKITAYKIRNRERRNERSRAYRAAHPEVASKEKAYRMTRKTRIAERNRISRFKRKYGITIEHWNKLFEIQKGICPICKNKMTKTAGKRKASTDHCHGRSGHVRGLICGSCNLAEGLLGAPAVALAMYNYMLQNELLSYQNGNKPPA